MVTAYDAPERAARRRGRRRPDPRRRLGGDGRARPRLDRARRRWTRCSFLTRAVDARRASGRSSSRDMPFGSFQVSDEEAIDERDPLRQGGAAPTRSSSRAPGRSLSRVRAIVGAGIPVMGHIGLTPQSATMLGGFKAQGRTAEKARAAYEDALALEAAGCFAIVLEAVPAPVAARITAGARRSRRSGSAPARAATARCSSATTCSASTRAARRGS